MYVSQQCHWFPSHSYPVINQIIEPHIPLSPFICLAQNWIDWLWLPQNGGKATHQGMLKKYNKEGPRIPRYLSKVTWENVHKVDLFNTWDYPVYMIILSPFVNWRGMEAELNLLLLSTSTLDTCNCWSIEESTSWIKSLESINKWD